MSDQGTASASDTELIRRVSQRDHEALLALYDRYAARIRGVIRQVVRDDHDTADVMQNVLIELWTRHAARYNPALGRVDAWIFRLARSRAIDHTRAAIRRREVAGSDTYAGAAVVVSGEKAATTDLGAMRSAIDRLADDVRIALLLAYAHAMTREEISEHLGVPVGTVKTRIRRGLAQLREHLAPSEVIA